MLGFLALSCILLLKHSMRELMVGRGLQELQCTDGYQRVMR